MAVRQLFETTHQLVAHIANCVSCILSLSLSQSPFNTPRGSGPTGPWHVPGPSQQPFAPQYAVGSASRTPCEESRHTGHWGCSCHGLATSLASRFSCCRVAIWSSSSCLKRVQGGFREPVVGIGARANGGRPRRRLTRGRLPALLLGACHLRGAQGRITRASTLG